MADWEVAGGIAKAAAGIGGFVFAAVRTWEHLARRRIQGARKRLLAEAYDNAQSVRTASTHVWVPIELRTKAEQRAARLLVEEGRASFHGNAVLIFVDRSPPGIAPEVTGKRSLEWQQRTAA